MHWYDHKPLNCKGASSQKYKKIPKKKKNVSQRED